MKRDINYALMGLLLLTLVSIVGLSAYYKYTFHDLGRRYSRARAELEVLYSELNKTQAELERKSQILLDREKALEDKESQVDEYFSALNISRQRESSLGDMFNQIRTENALLAKQLSDTQNEFDKTVKDFNALINSYTEKSAQLDTFKDLFSSVDESLLYLNERVKEIRFKANDIEESLGDMDDSVAGVKPEDVKKELDDQHDSMDAALNQLFYALDKLDRSLNATEGNASEIRNLG